MKTQPSQQETTWRRRLRCATYCIVLAVIVFIVWFFAPVIRLCPLPTHAMVESAIGPTSDAVVGWARLVLLPISVVVLLVVGTLSRRLVGPIIRKFQTTRPVRFLLGEAFEGWLLVVALAAGFVILLVAVTVGHQLGWSEFDLTLIGLRGLVNAVLIDHGASLVIANLLAFMIIGRDRVGKLAAPLIRFRDQGRYGNGGSGRIAGVMEEAPLVFSKHANGLYMGRSLYSPFRELGLGGDKHMLTFGPARSGWKGSSVIIPNILRLPPVSSLVTFDPKGTIFTVTERFLREQGKDCFAVSPISASTACFNPLDDLDPDGLDVGKQIDGIADALIVPSPNQRDPFWDRASQALLAGLLAHIITTYDNPVIPMLRDILTLPMDEQRVVWEAMSRNDRAGGLARGAAARLIRSEGQSELLSVMATVDSHTRFLGDPAFERILSRSDFAMADLKRRPTAIFLCVPIEALKTSRGFCRLFVNLQLAAMPQGGRSPIPILSIVDEAAGLGKMDAISSAYRETTNYNFTMWCFAQDLPSVACYGEELRSMMACSRGVQVTGIDDLTSAKYVSEMMGHHMVDGRPVFLRTPDEVIRDLSMESQRQYVLRSGQPPLLLRKIRYFEDPKLRGLYDPDPDFVR